MIERKTPPVNIVCDGRVGDMYHYKAFVAFSWNPSIRELESAGRYATSALLDHLPDMKLEMDVNGYDYSLAVSVGPYGKSVVLAAFGYRLDKEGESHIQGVTIAD